MMNSLRSFVFIVINVPNTASSSSLTTLKEREIIALPGTPQHCVIRFTLDQTEEHHERLQPQGGGRVCARQPHHQRRRRTPGKRDSRTHQVPQRRSRPGGSWALHESPACSLAKAYRLRGLHGEASTDSQAGFLINSLSELRRRSLVRAAMILIVLLTLLLSACGHPKQARVSVPPPPATAPTAEAPDADAANIPPVGIPPATASKKPIPNKPKEQPDEEAGGDLAEPALPRGAEPITTETGLASWYGPPYHNRRGSNGEIYNMHAMTAAHRTFPLGSIVRVTNVKTGHSALVRITDRGPFIPGRVLDLSLAAARKVDVWLPGVAEVKVELMQAPAAVDSGGKWAVQIGGFADEDAATKLADHLTRRYHTAKVLRFASPAGDWWIRVRVLDDDHTRAQQLAAETRTPEGAVFLVRLD